MILERACQNVTSSTALKIKQLNIMVIPTERYAEFVKC